MFFWIIVVFGRFSVLLSCLICAVGSSGWSVGCARVVFACWLSSAVRLRSSAICCLVGAVECRSVVIWYVLGELLRSLVQLLVEWFVVRV